MKNPVGVSAIAALKGGKLLMGRRNDDGKWCCPGGHIEPGESPTAAAHRELMEETGLVADGMMKQLDRKAVKDGEIHVHAFQADVAGEPSNEADPDAEFTEFRWVDPAAIPSDVMKNLHNEPDVVLDALGASGPAWASFEGEGRVSLFQIPAYRVTPEDLPDAEKKTVRGLGPLLEGLNLTLRAIVAALNSIALPDVRTAGFITDVTGGAYVDLRLGQPSRPATELWVTSLVTESGAPVNFVYSSSWQPLPLGARVYFVGLTGATRYSAKVRYYL